MCVTYVPNASYRLAPIVTHKRCQSIVKTRVSQTFDVGLRLCFLGPRGHFRNEPSSPQYDAAYPFTQVQLFLKKQVA